MQAFRIDVPDADLDDLRRRLAGARYPDQIGEPWALGTDRKVLEELVAYWRDEYDWRTREAYFNGFDQFSTIAAGEQVHGFHVRSPHAEAIPLVLVHGWPGSVVEFVDMIGPLTDPVAHGGDAADAFHVVVPSLPGYGFSGPTRSLGVDANRCADAVAEVMAQLGYERYIAQGGDWGAIVVRRMGEVYADRLIGVHFNMLFAMPGPDEADAMDGVTEEDLARFAAAAERIAGGTGYMDIQGTKPHTLGPAQADSPVGLAAWILEKFHAWCDLDDGDLESVFTKDQLLDNIMFYWLTNTATSAARLYCESLRAGTSAVSPWAGQVDVATGHAVYPAELLQTPRAWADRRYHIVHWSEQERGGHFAPYERPDAFVADVRSFARVLR